LPSSLTALIQNSSDDRGAFLLGQPLECEPSQSTDRETLGQEYRFSAPVQMARRDAERVLWSSPDCDEQEHRGVVSTLIDE
jgi:hypothetical protein